MCLGIFFSFEGSVSTLHGGGSKANFDVHACPVSSGTIVIRSNNTCFEQADEMNLLTVALTSRTGITNACGSVSGGVCLVFAFFSFFFFFFFFFVIQFHSVSRVFQLI